MKLHPVGTQLRRADAPIDKVDCEVVGYVYGGYRVKWFTGDMKTNSWSEGGVHKKLRVVSTPTHFEEDLFTL